MRIDLERAERELEKQKEIAAQRKARYQKAEAELGSLRRRWTTRLARLANRGRRPS